MVGAIRKRGLERNTTSGNTETKDLVDNTADNRIDVKELMLCIKADLKESYLSIKGFFQEIDATTKIERIKLRT